MPHFPRYGNKQANKGDYTHIVWLIFRPRRMEWEQNRCLTGPSEQALRSTTNRRAVVRRESLIQSRCRLTYRRREVID